jgi:SAM-dependent methyltransferase
MHTAQPVQPLRVSQQDREALAWPFSTIIRRKASEFTSKALGKYYSGAGLICSDLEKVKKGFASLTQEQFDEYNLAQVWVERRHIPKAIDNRIPAEHAVVIDLGCGPGSSTALLSYFARPSWRITGYDLTEDYIALANARKASNHYRSREGHAIAPTFICQSIAHPLRASESGQELLAEASVDFAISSGVVGLYLDEPSLHALTRELMRVMKVGAFAAIDTGPTNPSSTLRRAMKAASDQSSKAQFVEVASVGSLPIFEPRPKRIFQKIAR